MSVDAREEALKLHAEDVRVVAEMRRPIDELASIAKQMSFHTTVAQDAEIMARCHLIHGQLSEGFARHDELMRAIFDLVGIPEK